MSKKKKRVRDLISVEEELAIILLFLAAGESYESLRYQFRISDRAMSLFIKSVCGAMFNWDAAFLGFSFILF